jgi:hypothetical protein
MNFRGMKFKTSIYYLINEMLTAVNIKFLKKGTVMSFFLRYRQ